MKRLMIRVGGELKQAGFISEGVFYKRVDATRHLMEVLDAWGIDKQVFDGYVRGCQQIRILDEANGVVYVTTPEEYDRMGTTGEHKPYGEQVFLARRHFTKEPFQPK